MQITALVKSPDHVCSRYRIEAFRPHLEAAGHRLEVLAWPAGLLSRARLYWHLRGTDVLIIQRRLLPPFHLRMIRERVPVLVYDYDDSVFIHNSYHEGGNHSPRRAHRFEQTVAVSDVVVAGNSFLAQHAVDLLPPERIAVIPTCVDVEAQPLAQHHGTGPLKLGWIGSSSTIQGLERIAPMLEDWGKRIEGVQLRVICDRSLNLEHLPVTYRPWSRATEAAELAECDIGISWLPDDPWSAGKCGLKILQYMATGLPVVANPVGVHPALVRDFETGFLADTPERWLWALQELKADQRLRRRMGEAGRELARTHYDVSVGADAWLKLLDRLAVDTMTQPAERP